MSLTTYECSTLSDTTTKIMTKFAGVEIALTGDFNSHNSDKLSHSKKKKKHRRPFVLFEG